MQKSAIHKARDLSPELRRAAEALLGQRLDEDETVTLRASKGYIIREAPSGEARQEAFRQLLAQMDKIAGRVKDAPQDELDALIDEAVAQVRSHRQ